MKCRILNKLNSAYIYQNISHSSVNRIAYYLDWPMDAAQLDFKEELTLERKRQQLQRELALELQKERLLNENVTITKTVSY